MTKFPMLHSVPLTFSVMSIMWLTIGYVGTISDMINLTECLSYTTIMLTVWLFICYSILMLKEKNYTKE